MGADRSIRGNIVHVLIGLVLFSQVMTAQARRTNPLVDVSPTRDKVTVPTALPAPQPALESIIDPAYYYVGPSDGFDINIWIDPPISVRLVVTPEGTLIIPSVGEIPVAEMPLSAARAKVLAEIKKRFRFGECSVTLVAPRSVVISVQGRVLNPGSFVLPAYSRIDKAIEDSVGRRQPEKLREKAFK